MAVLQLPKERATKDGRHWYFYDKIKVDGRTKAYMSKSYMTRTEALRAERDFCASLLINTGQPVTTVSKYLGHASTKETLDTYAHMFPNNLTDVKNTMDNLNLSI